MISAQDRLWKRITTPNMTMKNSIRKQFTVSTMSSIQWLLVTLDQLTLPPLDFSRHFLAMKSSVADCLAAQSNAPAEVLEEIPALLESISKVCESADLLYEKIQEINNPAVSTDFPMVSGLSSKLLHIFRKMQDYFVRLDWQDAVCFPHAAASQNLCHLEQAVHALESQNITAATGGTLMNVDNNLLRILFDEEVYYHFTGIYFTISQKTV